MAARIFLVFALNALVATCPLLCQTSSPPAVDTDRSVIHTSTREVLLDLVVRDKHHHPVMDLRPEEVEIYEDGVRQKVRVFRNVQGRDELANERDDAGAQKAAVPVKSGETPHPLNTMRQVNFVSVVFAQIAPLNLEFARRALQEFLKTDNLPNTYVTIYRLDRTLQLLQSYTIDKDSLAKAVDTATKGLKGGGQLDVSAEVASSAVATLQATAENILASPATGPSTAQGVLNALANPLPGLAKDPLWMANAASQDVSVQLGNALLTQAALAKGLRFSTSLSDGMDAMDSLHELVRSEELLPGRKVVLYLADGLTFPINRRDAVDNLISYANRSGVSFYTIDTRGLNLEDPMMQALAAQRRTGAESVAQKVDPVNGHLEDDDVQLTAVSSPQLAMRELAESTGGFAVTNTNEISLPMQHMMEDIRSHYELAYAPTSTNYDGHFRTIDVKISRPKVTLQTRKGYYAVPDLNGEPLQPFELLALNAMSTSHADQGFPYQVSAMKFRPQEYAVEYEVTFEVPLSGIKPIVDKKTGDLSFRAALVAFIHDLTRGIVNERDQCGSKTQVTCFLIDDGLDAGQRNFESDFIFDRILLRPELHGRNLVGKSLVRVRCAHRIQRQEFERLERLAIQVGNGVVAFPRLQRNFWPADLDVDGAEVPIIIGRGRCIRQLIVAADVLHHMLHGQGYFVGVSDREPSRRLG